MNIRVQILFGTLVNLLTTSCNNSAQGRTALLLRGDGHLHLACVVVKAALVAGGVAGSLAICATVDEALNLRGPVEINWRQLDSVAPWLSVSAPPTIRPLVSAPDGLKHP